MILVGFYTGPRLGDCARLTEGNLRERVRDGLSPEHALRESADFIRSAALDGDVDFLATELARALSDIKNAPQRFQRTVLDWIHRAWLPLALWRRLDEPQIAHNLMLQG